MRELRPCPCGSPRAPIMWRAAPKAYRFRLRCPRCGFQARVAASEPPEMDRHWNEAVVLDRIARGEEP